MPPTKIVRVREANGKEERKRIKSAEAKVNDDDDARKPEQVHVEPKKEKPPISDETTPPPTPTPPPTTKKKEDGTYTKILYKFLDATTAHGWAHIGRIESSPLRTFWFVLTVSALACTLFQVIVMISQYLQYPTQQVSSRDYNDITFPSVSVCNLQPISMTTAALMVANSSTQFSRWNNLTL